MAAGRDLCRDENGSALLAALTLTLVLVALGLALVNQVTSNSSKSGEFAREQQAQLLADAGLNKAVWWFNEVYEQPDQASLDTSAAPVAYNDGSVTAPLSLPDHHPNSYLDCKDGASQTDVVTSFQDNLVNQSLNGGTFSVQGERLITAETACANGGTPDKVEMWQITSTGTYHGVTKTAHAIVRRKVEVRWDHAAFSKSNTTLEGYSQTKSFDFSTGSYSLASETWSNQCDCGAKVGTNATSTSSISVDDFAVVNGKAIPGPDSPPSAVTIAANATVTGATSSATMAKALSDPPPVSPCGGCGDFSVTGSSTATIGPGNYGTITVDGNASLTLDPGTFEITDLKLLSNGELRVSGDVRLLVRNGVVLESTAMANEGGAASLLEVILTKVNLSPDAPTVTNADFRMTGGTKFFGTVYAPKGKVLVEGKFYGGVIADRLKLDGNAIVFYDKDLRNSGVRTIRDFTVPYSFAKP